MNDTPAASYTVATARPRDLRRIPQIELAAAQLLAGYAPASVLNETTSEDELARAQARGHLWVARRDETPVGFAHVEEVESRSVHLEELDVHPDHGRRGLGTRLVGAVLEWARASGYDAVTLSTFRDVPWNMPFYARLGFAEIPATELSPALQAVRQDESRRGLDPSRRVVMRHRLRPPVE